MVLYNGNMISAQTIISFKLVNQNCVSSMIPFMLNHKI